MSFEAAGAPGQGATRAGPQRIAKQAIVSFLRAVANDEAKQALFAQISGESEAARQYFASNAWKDDRMDAAELAFFEAFFRNAFGNPSTRRSFADKASEPEQPLSKLLLEVLDQHGNANGKTEFWSEIVPFLIGLEQLSNPGAAIHSDPTLHLISGAGGEGGAPGLDLDPEYMAKMVGALGNAGVSAQWAKISMHWSLDMGYVGLMAGSDSMLGLDPYVDDLQEALARDGARTPAVAGYSFGAVVAARGAIKALEDDPARKLDYVLLVAPPIVQGSDLSRKLEEYTKAGRIGKLIIVNVEGDPFSSPTNRVLAFPKLIVQLARWRGAAPHFTFARAENDEARAELAARVADALEGRNGITTMTIESPPLPTRPTTTAN